MSAGRQRSSEKIERSDKGDKVAASPSHAPSSSTPAASGKDIWAMAFKERDSQKSVQDEERTLLFLGNKNSGKTTIIDRFLEKAPEVPKPTVALEYKFSRKSKGLEQTKDVVHVWELAGGAVHSKLVEAVITSSSLKNIAVIFVLDLSNPNDLWLTLDALLKAVRARIDKVASDLAAKDSKIAAQLKKKSWQKYGDDHPDKEWLSPMPIPLIIVGSKYDCFQTLETEKRKLICNALRFSAHANGASLLFVSEKDEASVVRLRAILNYLAFKSSAPSRVIAVDPGRPLVVPVGTDSLAQIGVPPIPSGDVSALSAKRPHELWQAVLASVFPPEAARQETADPALNPKFAEAAIDAMRAQKDEELEKYKRDTERKAREAAHRTQVEEGNEGRDEGSSRDKSRDRDRERGDKDKDKDRGDKDKDRGDRDKDRDRSSSSRRDSSRTPKK